MGGSNREGKRALCSVCPVNHPAFANRFPSTGGKAKPLKAPKKGTKDYDEDDLAFQEKKRAGTNTTSNSPPRPSKVALTYSRGEGS